MLPARYNAESALIAFFSLLSITSAQSSNVCQSYGIDFQDGGSYCINSASSDNFTFVTQFEGCATTGKNTFANTLFVPPAGLNNGEVMQCSDIDDTVPDINEVATCPITKSDLISGNYLIILAGNNGDGNPYAYSRNITLSVGPQQTTTTTPTVTFSVTTTPSTTITTTLYTTTTSTLDATTTYYTPATTAPCSYTVYPTPVSTTITETLTWHRNKYIPSPVVTLVTVTPSCVYQSPWADPTFPIWPIYNRPFGPPRPWSPLRPWNPWGPGLRSNAPPQETAGSVLNNYNQVLERGPNRLDERAPDACTITITASPPVSVTTTVAAPTVTETDSTTITLTTSTYLPPSTVPSGTTTLTTTLPPGTRTRLQLVYTTEISTSTLIATYTEAVTTTPPGAKASCWAMGGYLVGQGGW